MMCGHFLSKSQWTSLSWSWHFWQLWSMRCLRALALAAVSFFFGRYGFISRMSLPLLSLPRSHAGCRDRDSFHSRRSLDGAVCFSSDEAGIVIEADDVALDAFAVKLPQARPGRRDQFLESVNVRRILPNLGRFLMALETPLRPTYFAVGKSTWSGCLLRDIASGNCRP